MMEKNTFKYQDNRSIVLVGMMGVGKTSIGKLLSSETILPFYDSDNKIYKPYEEILGNVLELWEFTCCINTQEYDADELKLSSIVTMFQDLKVELKSIKGLERYV